MVLFAHSWNTCAIIVACEHVYVRRGVAVEACSCECACGPKPPACISALKRTYVHLIARIACLQNKKNERSLTPANFLVIGDQVSWSVVASKLVGFICAIPCTQLQPPPKPPRPEHEVRASSACSAAPCTSLHEHVHKRAQIVINNLEKVFKQLDNDMIRNKGAIVSIFFYFFFLRDS